MNSCHAPLLCVLAVLAFTMLTVQPAGAYDAEWPPQADPPYNPPAAGLAPGIIDAAMPAEIGAWLNHRHEVPWLAVPLACAVGDVEGPDDGDLDLVVYVTDDIIAALRMEIDWYATPKPTLRLTPLWAKLLPYAERDPSHPFGGLGGVPPTTPHLGWDETSIAIWDFDGDGCNEVAFSYNDDPHTPQVGGYWGSTRPENYLYVVQTDPEATGPGTHFSVPEPRVLATLKSAGNAQIDARVGVCKVRDDGYDIVLHGHNGQNLTVVRLTEDANGNHTLTPIYYNRICCEKIAHEFNYTDIDGDGYDEFMQGGVHDFVDADGPTNGVRGVARWYCHASGDNAHTDQVIAADFDPTLPGIEILSLPEGRWTDRHGVVHANGYPTLWDAAGNIIRENTDAPTTHPQSVAVGNFTDTRAGLESLLWPKGGGLRPPAQHFSEGGFSQDAFGEELATDGMDVNLPNGWRCGGPPYSARQIDWDGDYSRDEMLNSSRTCLYVWRMGEKGDWLPGAPPSGMPTAQQAIDGWMEGGILRHWFWSYDINVPGHGDWENGGAGPFTHYYQKLVETSLKNWWFDLYCYTAYDLGRDYREEFVAVARDVVRIHYNPAPAEEPARHPSPALYDSYRRFQYDFYANRTPFIYADQPILQSIELQPDTLYIAVGDIAKATVIGHYSDGTSIDISGLVDWYPDAALSALAVVGRDGTIEAGPVGGSGTLYASTYANGAEIATNTLVVNILADSESGDCPDCEPTDQTVFEVGADLCLEVPDDAAPGSTFYWTRNGKSLIERTERVTCRTLRIAHLNPEDSGTYECVYQDGSGATAVYETAITVTNSALPVAETADLCLLGLAVALTMLLTGERTVFRALGSGRGRPQR